MTPSGRGQTSADAIVIVRALRKDFHPRRYCPRPPRFAEWRFVDASKEGVTQAATPPPVRNKAQTGLYAQFPIQHAMVPSIPRAGRSATAPAINDRRRRGRGAAPQPSLGERATSGVGSSGAASASSWLMLVRPPCPPHGSPPVRYTGPGREPPPRARTAPRPQTPRSSTQHNRHPANAHITDGDRRKRLQQCYPSTRAPQGGGWARVPSRRGR